MIKQNKQKTSRQMIDLSLTISKIILSINCLNNPTKMQGLSAWVKVQNTILPIRKIL